MPDSGWDGSGPNDECENRIEGSSEGKRLGGRKGSEKFNEVESSIVLGEAAGVQMRRVWNDDASVKPCLRAVKLSVWCTMI